MKLILLNVEDGIASNGFRRLVAHARSHLPSTSAYYLTPSHRLFLDRLIPSKRRKIRNQLTSEVARSLAGADIVGFSSVSIEAQTVERIIAELRQLSPQTFIVWGGSHGIMAAESAIQHADAVCTGEGELAFQQLVEALRLGHEPFSVANFWFRKGSKVIKNPFLPLLTPQQLDLLPPPSYADPDDRIYVPGRGFLPLTTRDYLTHNGLSYRTVWSLGCPFHCTFCGNTKYIANNPGYRKIRHAPVSALIRELEQVRRRHPHVRSFVFEDDSFMALPLADIEHFCDAYSNRIGIPFTVTGVIPNYVQERKLALLTAAGLVRVRMGIQSGSQRMLTFYQRPSPPAKVMSAATTLHQFSDSMMPPDFDIIVDNPVETRQDVRETLQLVYDLPRPFNLNIFSLTVMPNTELGTQLEELGMIGEDSSRNYKALEPTLANSLLYLLAIVRPPRWIFDRLLSRADCAHIDNRRYPLTLRLIRMLWLVRRALGHLFFMGFVNFPGIAAYASWKLGIVDWRLAAHDRRWRMKAADNPRVID